MICKYGVMIVPMGKFLSFVATFCVLFALTVAFMLATDTVPDSTDNTAAGDGVTVTEPPPPQGTPEAPVRIVAKDIRLDVSVSNPTTTDVEELDKELLHGGVRYPTSAMLGENGTVLLFGHSSYLPIVHNQNYKAFDGIQNLKPGEVVSVYSATQEYRFAVTGVRVANAQQDVVDLPSDAQYLTLVTCDSFATKSDRYVVTAKLDRIVPLQ